MQDSLRALHEGAGIARCYLYTLETQETPADDATASMKQTEEWMRVERGASEQFAQALQLEDYLATTAAASSSNNAATEETTRETKLETKRVAWNASTAEQKQQDAGAVASLSSTDAALMRDTMTVELDAEGNIARLRWLASISRGHVAWRPLTQEEAVACCNGEHDTFVRLQTRCHVEALRREVKQRLDRVTSVDVLRKLLHVI